MESEVLSAAIKSVAKTGAFVGALSSAIRSQVAASSPLFPSAPQSQVGRGGTGIFSVRPQAAIGGAGSAFPYQTYNLGTTQFPTDIAAQLSAPRNRGTDANRVVSEGIRKYRAAVDNFWEGEDSQFQALTEVVASSARLSAARFARKIQQTKSATNDQPKSGLSRGVKAIGDWINGDLELGVTRFTTQATQNISDSVLNSIEALGFSVSNSFSDGIDRIRGLVPGSVSLGLESASDAIRDLAGLGGFGGGRGGGGAVPPVVPPAGGGGAADEARQLLALADANIATSSTNELESFSQGLNQLRNSLSPTIEGFDALDNQLRETINNIGDLLESRAPGTDPLMRRFPGRRGRAISEGLIGGAFPLLFGQGVGASVGGGLGGAAGALVGGGLGFGLSLAGTAIGAELDKAVIAAGQLNSAFLTAAGSYSEIRKQGIQFTAELENQVNLLKQSGDFAAAAQLERGAVQGATGDINAVATEGVAAAGAVLSATWNDAYKSIQTTLGILASPFLFALNALLTPVKALFQGFNAIASLIANIPGVREVFAGWNEQAYKTTQEYQDQLAEIQKQINEADKLNNIQAEQVNYARQSLGLSRTDTEILGRRAEAAKRAAENEKEIEKIRRENPTRTEEQRQKVNQLVFQQQRKFILEESAIAFTKAQEIFLEIQDNNRQIAQQKKEYEQQYQDFLIDRTREQADLSLEAVRKVQDARLKGLEQEAKAAKEIADERLRSAEIAAGRRSLAGSVQAAISDDPITGELLNNVQTAIDKWRNGRQSVENETANRQRQLQLEIQRGEVQIQRYKYDMAVKIARANEDSQKKIARINEQINRQNEETSRRANLRKLVELSYETELQIKQAEMDKSQAKQALASKFNITPVQKEYYANQLANAEKKIKVFGLVFKELEEKLAKAIEVPPIPAMQNIPALTKPSADVARAEAAVLGRLKTTENLITSLKAVNEIDQENLTLAETIIGLNRQGLDQGNQALTNARNELSAKQETVKLMLSGAKPAMAEQIAQLRVGIDLQEKLTKSVLGYFKAQKAIITNPEAKKALQTLIDDLQSIADALPQKLKSAIDAINKAEEPIKGEKIAESYSAARERLQELATWENVAVTGAEAIGDAFGNAFRQITAGTASAQEVLAGFFQSLADRFSDMAARMIQDMILMLLYKKILGPLFGLDLSGGGLFGFSKGGVPGMSGGGGDTLSNFNAAAAAYSPEPFAMGGILSEGAKPYPFAKGGIVDSPTLFKFADGGAMNTGLMGEAGPEAILPLSRGSDGKLGVSANGSGSGTTNVTVNVDASGSKVQGDDGAANKLGKAVAIAVQQEILKQKRPGGLL